MKQQKLGEKQHKLDDVFVIFQGLNGAKLQSMQFYAIFVDLVESLSNEYMYVLSKIGVDTAQNEPLKVWS